MNAVFVDCSDSLRHTLDGYKRFIIGVKLESRVNQNDSFSGRNRQTQKNIDNYRRTQTITVCKIYDLLMEKTTASSSAGTNLIYCKPPGAVNLDTRKPRKPEYW